MLKAKRKMAVKECLGFLIRQYHFSYVMMTVENYCGSGGTAYAHSFYNDSGCFTVLDFPAKGELDFFISDVYAADLQTLCKKQADVRAIAPEVWARHEKKSLLNRLFFWNRPCSVLAALGEAMQVHMEKHGACLRMPVDERERI